MRFGGYFIGLAAAGAVLGVFAMGAEVGAQMTMVANHIFELFREKEFPLLLAAAILGVAFSMALLYGAIVVGPRSLHLRRLRRWLDAVADEPAFAAEYDSINNRLKNSRLVGHAWKEFAETLVLPDTPDDVVQNTTRPHSFINYHCAADGSVALRIMPHIPNYFVGVGLLLTFIGLVAALNFANTAVGGDVDQAVAGLQDLLAAATFKFWTSIAGLLSSIALSFIFRLYSMHLEGRFAAFCRALEDRMVFATPQRIFVDVRETMAQQLAETKKINTEVAMSIGDSVGRQFKEHVPGVLSEALRPLVEAVEESTNKVGRGATEGLDRMVEEFVRSIEGSAGRQMQDLSDTLARLQQSLSSMHGSMNSSGDDFARRMAEGSERLNATMQDVAAAMRDLIDGLKAEVGAAGQAFGSTLEESLNRLAQQSERMADEIAGRSREASASFAQEVTSAARALSETANDNARASSAMSENIRKAIGESVDGLQGGLDRVSESLTLLDAQLVKQGSALGLVSQRSQDTARAMAEIAAAVRGGLAPFQAFGQSLADAASRMEAAAASVKDVSGRLSGVSESMQTIGGSTGEQMQALSETLAALQGSLSSMYGAMNTSGDDFARRLAEGAERLDATMKQVASSMSVLTDGLTAEVGRAGETFGSRLEESLARLAEQSERTAEDMAGRSRQASAAFAEEIAKAARVLSETSNDSARASSAMSQKIRDALGESVDGIQAGLDRVAASLAALDVQLVKQQAALGEVSVRSQEAAEAMGEAALGVRTGLAPFQEIGRTLSESGSSLERSVTEIADRVDAAAGAVQDVSGHLNEVSKALQGAWESYRVRFEGVDEDLEQTFQRLHEAVETQQRQVQDFVKGLDASFSNAINSLSGGIDGINSSVEDLTEILEKAARGRTVGA